MLEQIIPLPAPFAIALGMKDAPRHAVESIVSQLIETLDAAEGDADLEETDCEDSFVISRLALGFVDGPGCPIADMDKGDEDDGDRASWAEWHTLPVAQRRAGHIDGKPLDSWSRSVLEDDEEDDADTSVEDDPRGFDPEEDYGLVELGELDEVEFDLRPTADPQAYREHLHHIRRTRCESFVRWGRREHRLRDDSFALDTASELMK